MIIFLWIDAHNRKNWLFAGSERAGQRAAAIQSLLATAKLNGLEPLAWLTETLEKLPTCPNNQLDTLLPLMLLRPARLVSNSTMSARSIPEQKDNTIYLIFLERKYGNFHHRIVLSATKRLCGIVVPNRRYRTDYPNKPLESQAATQAWTQNFARWNNQLHRHSGLAFVTPAQRREDRDTAVRRTMNKYIARLD